MLSGGHTGLIWIKMKVSPLLLVQILNIKFNRNPLHKFGDKTHRRRCGRKFSTGRLEFFLSSLGLGRFCEARLL
jgi:hypothetical protein